MTARLYKDGDDSVERGKLMMQETRGIVAEAESLQRKESGDFWH